MPARSLFAGKETLTYGMTICLGAKRLHYLGMIDAYELASSLRIASAPVAWDSTLNRTARVPYLTLSRDIFSEFFENLNRDIQPRGLQNGCAGCSSRRLWFVRRLS